MSLSYTKAKVNKLKPLHDTIIVSDMEFGERITQSGLIMPNDDMKSSGIRPRWAKVYAIGPKQKDVKVGQYIYIAHGRWTRGITIETPEGEKVIRKVDNNDVLLVSDEYISDYNISDKAI
jgi:co-chaperonin GroES (HSP10)